MAENGQSPRCTQTFVTFCDEGWDPRTFGHRQKPANVRKKGLLHVSSLEMTMDFAHHGKPVGTCCLGNAKYKLFIASGDAHE